MKLSVPLSFGPPQLRRMPWMLLAQRSLNPTTLAFVLAGALLLPSPAPAEAQESLPTLMRVEQVHKLTPEEARRGHPLKLTGVITLADPARGLWFVQDPTGGIFCWPQDRSAVWRAGQQVEVTGLSAQGSHLPYLNQASLRELGSGPLPPAKKASFGHLATDEEDANWVEVHGVVRQAEVVDSRLVLALAADGRRLRAIVSEGTLPWEDYSSLVDAEVRLQAVCGMVDRNPQSPFFLDLNVPSITSLTVEVKAPDQPYALPLQPIARIPLLSGATGLVHRVRIKGAVATNTAGTLLLSDGTGAVELQSQQSFQIRSNQLLEAVGFPAGGAASRPVLEEVTGRELILGSPYVKPGAPMAENPAPDYLPVLNRIEQIRRLGPEEADCGYPIRVRGVVTYCDSEWYCLFVQDETAGIYVDVHGQSFQQAPGTVLQVEGFSGPGDYAPVILQPRFQVMGQAPRPTSRHATLGYLRMGREDSQPVTVEGIVRSMRIENGHLYLEVGSGSGPFQCLLPGFWQKSAPTNLVDALVQVTGVCATLFNQRRQLVGIQLFVQDLADLAVLKPAPEDPYATPIRPISALLRFSPEGASGHRAHIQGTVTLQRRGESFFVQDETGGVQVHSVQTNELRPGDRVAVLGFPENTGFTPDLHDAVFRKLGTGAVPAAVQVTPEQALGTNFSGDLFDGRLVQMEARVLEYLPRLTAPTLVLEAQGRTFYAVAMDSGLRGWMRALHREDQVRVTGVCSVQAAPDGVPGGFQLLLGKSSDLVVLARAPWLTLQRMLLALGGLGLICLLGLAWVVLLKHQVQRHTAKLLLSNNLLHSEVEDRTKAETALRERETQLRLALEAARMGTWDWDIPAGRNVWSPGHEALWGYAPGTFPGTYEGYESRLHPDDVEGARRAGQKALDEHSNYEHEYRVCWPDGTMRWVASRGQAFYGLDDKPTRMVGVAMDITERKQAEETLRQTAELLHRIIDSSPISIFTLDQEGRLTSWNPASEQVFGWSAREVLGQRLPFIPPEKQAEHAGLRAHALAGESFHSREVHRVRRDGSPVVLSIFTAPLRNATGQVTGILALNVDITERQRAEEQLRRDEARFRSLAKVLQFHAETTQDFLDFALQEAIALTGSKLGYIYFYNEDRKQFVLNTWSKEVMKECSIANPQICYELDKTGLWGEAVRQRQPILLNDFQAAHPLKKGYPEGHAPLHKYLTLPIFSGDQIVAVAAVANKERDYDEKDIQQLRLLMDAVWKVVEQRKAVEALGDSEERFRTLVETAPDAIFIQTNGRFAYVNTAALRLFGAARPEGLLGQPMLDRLHPDCRDRVGERIQVVTKKRQPVPALDEVYLRLDGSPVGVSVSAVPFNYQNQAGGLVFARDITERKRAEAEAALSTLRTQVLLELHQLAAAPREQVLDFALEASLRITQSEFSFLGLMDETETVMTIHRWSKEAMTQCALSCQPRIFPIAEAGLWADCVRQRKPALVNDYAAPHPGKTGIPEGHVPIRRFLAVPIFDGARLVAGAAVANKPGDYTQADSAALTSLMNELWEILQRQRAEEEIHQLNAELEQRVRNRTAQLEAINQELEAFSYSVSHDLRAPLRGIDGWAQALLEDFGDKLGKTGLELLHRQRAASQRMGTLIDDLLRLSRLARQPLARQTVAPATLVGQAWEELRPAQPSQAAELVVGGLPECQADSSLLTQVFVNLLGNALKFSSRQAHPRIEVGSQTGSDHPCVYFVKDNGAGFDMRYADKLFGAFQRLHSAHEFPGTGIGLAITQRIIHRHGGRIWAESAVGQGATFFFTLAGGPGTMKHEEPSAV